MDWQELGETTMDPATRIAAPGVGRRGRHRRRGLLEAHGRRRRGPQELHPGEREGRPLPRRLTRRRAVAARRTEPQRESAMPDGDGVPDDAQPTLEPNIEPIEIQEEMERSFLDYAMSVITARALPDARDGLKPVHRRILYGMYEDGLRPDRKHKKSRVGGRRRDGQVPPARRRRRSTTRWPAWPRTSRCATRSSTATGTSARPTPTTARRAARYTEARLAPLAMQLLGEIDEDTVDFVAQLRRQHASEPVVLPARFPNLLVNGGGGIAVGMATNIPPHNLGEVIDAALHLLDNPDATVDDLMQFVKGPDFPTGRADPRAQRDPRRLPTGRGSIKMRAVAEIEETASGDTAHRRHRDAVPDVGRGDRPEDRRARQRPQDRGHPRRAQRVGGRHDAARRSSSSATPTRRSC